MTDEMDEFDREVSRGLRKSLVQTLTARGMSLVDANGMADMAERMGREMGDVDTEDGS